MLARSFIQHPKVVKRHPETDERPAHWAALIECGQAASPGGVRRTIIALPESRCVHVALHDTVRPFAAQVASQLTGRLGGSLYVRNYPNSVNPDVRPDWPGYRVFPEQRANVRDIRRRAARRLIAAWMAGEAEFSAPEQPSARDPSLEALTPREREHHLARGYSYKRIGARLRISARTVECHVGAVRCCASCS